MSPAPSGPDDATRGSIVLDTEDLRDLIYRPSLGLLPVRFLCAALDPAQGAADPGAGRYPSGLRIRDQDTRPSCIGEALAAVVDIQRIESIRHPGAAAHRTGPVEPVSAAMLHAMALEAENLTRETPTQDIYSLRSGLKGFYNTGVCPEETWHRHANAGAEFDAATVPVMIEARNVTLGAYYRVQSFINDYHAALVEAGALYVSAELHRGWRKPARGVIDQRVAGGDPFGGGHAFVVVGYDRDGFLVLNSWGPGWGGYAWDGHVLPGVALWPYDDWAAHVLDCWVLRLAAPTPESFRHAVGQQGAAGFGAGRSPLALSTVRRMEVLGRYLHLQDGAYMQTGAYPASAASLNETVRHLRDEGAADFDHIRLTFHGDTAPVETLMARVARTIPEDKRQRVHGFAVIWANGLLSGAAAALEPLFEAAQILAKGKRDDADRRIEQMTRPVGRAIWRDVKRSATLAGQPGGDAAVALAQIVALCTDSGKRLHLVAEGAGSLLLAELLASVGQDEAAVSALVQVLASVTLVAPLSTQAEFNRACGPVLEVWQGRAALLVPDRAFDERLAVGAYSLSWTELVARAFEDGDTPLIGAPGFRGQLRGRPERLRLAAPKGKNGRLTSDDVLQHPQAAAHLAATIDRARIGDTAPTTGG